MYVAADTAYSALVGDLGLVGACGPAAKLRLLAGVSKGEDRGLVRGDVYPHLAARELLMPAT